MSNATAKSGKPKTPTSEKSDECTECGKYVKNGVVQYDAADQRHSSVGGGE